MQGTVVKVVVEDGQQVEADEVVAVLEAMKMENPVPAHKPGVVAELAVASGDAIAQGERLCEIRG
jgi:acetyl-CoA/propionyl-CoA carboxylase biotin carboxyl carrier protein